VEIQLYIQLVWKAEALWHLEAASQTGQGQAE